MYFELRATTTKSMLQGGNIRYACLLDRWYIYSSFLKSSETINMCAQNIFKKYQFSNRLVGGLLSLLALFKFFSKDFLNTEIEKTGHCKH